MKKLLFLAALIAFKAVSAQVAPPSADTTGPALVVHKDPRVDALVRKQSDINTATRKATARTMKGYRLLVINTNKRDEAIAAKTKVYTYFPDQKAYLVYQAPYFRLKVGNFKTREEAVKYQKNMSRLFPKGVFILNDTIEIKPELTDEE